MAFMQQSVLLQAIENFSLSNAQLCESGKFEMLDKMLPNMHEADDRVLLFTQVSQSVVNGRVIRSDDSSHDS